MPTSSLTLTDGATLSWLTMSTPSADDSGRGDRAPILLLHGFTGTARRHLGNLMPPLLADGYRLIAPDLRGYGASRPPNRSFPPDFYQRDTADIIALLDHLQLGPVAVLGFSDGAEIALLLAAARPDLVAGVLAWGVSGVISSEHVDAVQSWLPVSAWGPERAAWQEQIIADHGEEQLEPMISGWVRAAEAIAAAGGNVCLAEAAAIRCPVLLVNGDGEVGNTVRDVTRLAERIPGSRLVFVANSGHWVHTDQEAQFLTQARDFLRQLTTQPDPGLLHR